MAAELDQVTKDRDACAQQLTDLQHKTVSKSSIRARAPEGNAPGNPSTSKRKLD
jgi:hypothetical protein